MLKFKKSLGVAFLCISSSLIFLGCDTAYIITPSNLAQSNDKNQSKSNNIFSLSDDNIVYSDSSNTKDSKSTKVPIIDSNFSILVNKQNSIEKSYVPEVKVPSIPYGTNSSVRYDIVDPVEKLFKDAKSQGFTLILTSGYRSYDTQASIYNSNLKNKGETWTSQFSAKPGHSEHQTGLALDISSVSQGGGLYQSFGDTDEGKWLRNNCANYGFILRYLENKKDITGYTYEPWHFRYVGVEVAKYIMENNLTFEEYLEILE